MEFELTDLREERVNQITSVKASSSEGVRDTTVKKVVVDIHPSPIPPPRGVSTRSHDK